MLAALPWIAARPWALKALAVAGLVVAVVLFMFNLRRQGEAAGRNAERVRVQARTVEIQNAQLRAAADRPRDRDTLTRRMLSGEF